MGKPILVILSVFLACACDDKKKKGDPVEASLSMTNGTGSTALAEGDCPDLGGGFRGDECFTPTVFGLKILNVFVSPDEQGATSAPAGLIWGPPDCPVSTSESEIDDKTYEYDYNTGGDCTDDIVSTFFELARSSEEVNAELNSKEYRILPGTYNYVQIGFCIGGAKSKNARFEAEGMTEPLEIQSGTCGISSAKADPPIVVGEGSSVTVSLTYDLTNVIYAKADADGDQCYVSSDESIVRCFGYPQAMKVSMVQK